MLVEFDYVQSGRNLSTFQMNQMLPTLKMSCRHCSVTPANMELKCMVLQPRRRQLLVCDIYDGQTDIERGLFFSTSIFPSQYTASISYSLIHQR